MEEVRRLRQEKGWNQNELAFHADLAPSVISLLETGKREPNATTLRKLAEALEVRIPDLFEDSGSGKAQAPLPLEESERGVAWMANVLERVLATWERQVREKENHYQSRTIAVAALDIQDAVTFNYKPVWDSLSYREKTERHALAERIDTLVLAAFDHYKQAKKAEADEVEAIRRRREEIRERTREISA